MYFEMCNHPADACTEYRGAYVCELCGELVERPGNQGDNVDEIEISQKYPFLAQGLVLTWPHEALRAAAAPVPQDFDPEELAWIVKAMHGIVRRRQAVGLAGPQVGVPYRIFVMQVDGVEHTLINPTWAPGRATEDGAVAAAKKVAVEEACLSFPGLVERVERWDRVGVVYEVPETRGQGLMNASSFEGLAAQCVQHEAEHLEGVTLYDNIGPVKRDILKRKARKASRLAARGGWQ